MHRALGLLVSLSLGGCPPPPRYVVADVISPHGPVEDALVAADCGGTTHSALRTDEEGRARVMLYGRSRLPSCTLTVAKPGYWTVVLRGANVCSTPGCPPTVTRLDEDGTR